MYSVSPLEWRPWENFGLKGHVFDSIHLRCVTQSIQHSGPGIHVGHTHMSRQRHTLTGNRPHMQIMDFLYPRNTGQPAPQSPQVDPRRYAIQRAMQGFLEQPDARRKDQAANQQREQRINRCPASKVDDAPRDNRRH